MAISKFIRMADAGETIPVFGNGGSQRDYTYIDDAVSAVLAALAKPQDFAVLNVGGGSPIRLDALVEAIAQATGHEIQTDIFDEQPGDVGLTWADPSQIQERLGWSAQVDILEGLRRTVAAQREN